LNISAFINAIYDSEEDPLCELYVSAPLPVMLTDRGFQYRER